MKNVVSNIRAHTKEYIKEANLQSMVLGVSGGIDSAVVAALMRPVADDLEIPLIGISLPSESNKEDEVDRASAISQCFCSKSCESEIDTDVKELLYSAIILRQKLGYNNLCSDKMRILEGNIKARVRMLLLYDIANATNGIVLSTDNWTELMLGFWTLHGDVGDYGCIQNLTKTEVYNLAKWLINNEISDPRAASAITRCIDATPTDGLGVSESDYEQLGADSYEKIDKKMIKYLTLAPKEILSVGDRLDLQDLQGDQTIKRHLATHFKRNNPYNIPRSILGLKEVV